MPLLGGGKVRESCSEAVAQFYKGSCHGDTHEDTLPSTLPHFYLCRWALCQSCSLLLGREWGQALPTLG